LSASGAERATMLKPGDTICVAVEKPAAGGAMIGRVNGQVVLVTGAIPGERVTARIERVGKGVAYATTLNVDEPSADRRQPSTDLLCGGSLYAHIAYERQLQIKALVISDQFARIGRLDLPAPVVVASSPEEGYRMRARLHARGRRVGFFREGSHDICDARATRQLLPETCDVLDRVATAALSQTADACEIELSENVDASERAFHFDTAVVNEGALGTIALANGLTGLSAGQLVVGRPYVTDTVRVQAHSLHLRRHVLAFFQGNRYLFEDLATCVVGELPSSGELVDLYAGAGLFSIAAAVVRGVRVTAVEGDRVAAADLDANASASRCEMTIVPGSVERYLGAAPATPAAIIVDPPRTGMSRIALDGIVRLRSPRLVYVSCDVATLARDARRLVDAGYTIDRVHAFDLFPNTPHVETVVSFRL
jgi:23S rRNA (uracil1939-C5)-methyltransferase